MNSKITIYDVAKAAGVSIATVNRAMSDKPRISEKTRQRVLSAARALGYNANRAAQALSASPVNIGVFLTYHIPAFSREVQEGIEAAAQELADYNVHCTVFPTPSDICEAESFISDTLHSLEENPLHGVVLLTYNNPAFYYPLIAELRDKGVYVATVVTDIQGSRRALSVRADDANSGQMAAELLSLLCPRRKAVVFTSSQHFDTSVERLRGFRTQAQESGLEILHVYENYDRPELAYAAVDDMIHRYPEVDGLYISSANAIGACRRMEELGLQDRLKVVTTDLFDELSDYMDKGFVQATLFHNPRRHGQLVMETLYKMIRRECPPDKVILTPPHIVLNSNKHRYLHPIRNEEIGIQPTPIDREEE